MMKLVWVRVNHGFVPVFLISSIIARAVAPGFVREIFIAVSAFLNHFEAQFLYDSSSLQSTLGWIFRLRGPQAAPERGSILI